MATCMNCKMCQVHIDPDPFDEFCSDDKAARCLMSSATPSFMFGGPIAKEPYITVGCRPYMLENECQIPSWCPNGGEIVV